MTGRLAPQVTLCLSNNCFMTIHLHVFHFHIVLSSSFHFVIFNSKRLYLQQNVAAVIYQRQVYIRVYVLNEGDTHQNGDWRMRIIILTGKTNSHNNVTYSVYTVPSCMCMCTVCVCVHVHVCVCLLSKRRCMYIYVERLYACIRTSK